MFRRTACSASLLTLLFSIPLSTAIPQERATLTGTVKDVQTGDLLPGATVHIEGTGLGASSDEDGRFIIRNIPVGSYHVLAGYVGYQRMKISTTFKDGETCRHDFQLKAVGIEGEEVSVTAQAAGQKAAINQQLSALPIINVVSRARIQELPDANAAESVSRLPGVSLIRSGGEGSKVVVRGLSPQYNQITIDGVEMPSNVASTNNIVGEGGLGLSGDVLGDRGADLSMISSNMLGGIKVTKAITPDMDAAVLGGVVDFALRKAPRREVGDDGEPRWIPLFEFKVQGGYTELKNSYDNYRYTGSLEQRFFNQAFGLFVQGSAEKRNLSSNVLGANYQLIDKSHGDVPLPQINSMYLNDVFRKRERYGGTVVLDYQHESGEIALMNFLSTSRTQEITRGESMNAFGVSMYDDNLGYQVSEANNELNVISNLLSVKQDLSLVHADLRLSHSYSETRNPEDLYCSFSQLESSTFLANRGDLTGVQPSTLASWVSHDPAKAFVNTIESTTTLSSERTLTASLDIATDVALATDLSGRIKAGVMFQHRSRVYDLDWAGWRNLVIVTDPAATEDLQRALPWLVRDATGRIGMLSFMPDSYEYGDFLNGEYTLGAPLNVNRVWQYIHQRPQKASRRSDPKSADNLINDYSGYENKSAGYAMVALNLGSDLSLIPGVRYQNLTTNYTATHGILEPYSGRLQQGGDTSIERSHGYFLPMVHLRYRTTDWMQIHFAYTNTLNYPDYSTITPRYLIGVAAIDYNNRDLKPATSENLDLVVSFHSNAIGLLSFNGFGKRIKDLVFFSHMYVSDLSKHPELPQGGKQLYEFNTYINNPIPIDMWGIETEWQTHFWYLPRPFDGLVFNVNYTHIFSEASYPRSIVNTWYDDEGNMVQTITDTFYTARLLNQPNDIVNLALGYDYRGFSLRLSMLYQDNIFKRPDFWMQQRVLSAKFTRWDLSVKQDLPWLGLQLFFNISNITGEDDVDVNQKNGFAASQQRYGMSADVGVQIKL